MLVYPLGDSESSCCWGCLTFSINKNDKGRYDELFNQKCKEIECPPYAPGTACFPHKAVCANNECQAERIIDDYSMVEEIEIDNCERNSDCVVVPYSSCCGSTKRAINKKYKTLYFTKPSWQEFIGPCDLIGICPDDSRVTEATCENYDDNQMKCRLKF